MPRTSRSSHNSSINTSNNTNSSNSSNSSNVNSISDRSASTTGKNTSGSTINSISNPNTRKKTLVNTHTQAQHQTQQLHQHTKSINGSNNSANSFSLSSSNSTPFGRLSERLRIWVKDAIRLNLFVTAAFWGEKLFSITGIIFLTWISWWLLSQNGFNKKKQQHSFINLFENYIPFAIALN